MTHYATIDMIFLILLSLCYTSILGIQINIKREKISLLYLCNRSFILLHTNHLHNLLNASVDVLEKEMEWAIHNENEKIIKQPLHLHINCISNPSYIIYYTGTSEGNV